MAARKLSPTPPALDRFRGLSTFQHISAFSISVLSAYQCFQDIGDITDSMGSGINQETKTMVHIEVERKPTSTSAFWAWVIFFVLVALAIWAIFELAQ